MRWTGSVGSHPDKPTLLKRTFVHLFGCRFDIHKMIGVDAIDCFHTHPSYAIRIVLSGGYEEQFEDGTTKVWKPCRIGMVPPTMCHRISRVLNGRYSYSLWLRWRVIAPIELRGSGWKGQQ